MTDTVDTLKQRVVGAFVIISLAVIFLPMIFDEPHQQESNIIVPVPPRPSFQIKEIAKPIKPEFQRLEFNLEAQKVVAEEITALSVNNNVTEITQEADIKSSLPEKNESSDEIITHLTAPQTNTAQAIVSSRVSHLPIFKNVWMVQLGTFSQTENAYQLRDQLRKDGFDGHTKNIDLNGSKAIKVFTGPFVDKAEAEKIKLKLDEKYKLESRVIFFDA